jgi:hypothetical protein
MIFIDLQDAAEKILILLAIGGNRQDQDRA